MRALSARIGRSESYIKHILKGGNEPSLDAVLKIRDVLNMPLSSLIDGVSDDPDTEAFARKFSRLSAEQKVAVEAVINSLLQTADNK